jgi:hypothetical protein
MFVVPSKYYHNPGISFQANGLPHIVNCVRSLREHHPNEEILVIDSSSEDKSYFSKLEPYDVIIADINNTRWIIGALYYAYETYERDHYSLIHDSLEVRTNLDYYKQFDLSPFSYFNISAAGFPILNGISMEGWADEQLRIHTKFDRSIFDRHNVGIFGSAILCKRSVLDTIYNSGFNKIRITNKHQDMTMERLLGSVLAELGYDVRQNSVMGDFSNGWWKDYSPDAKAWKYFLNRV